jgi:DNA primase
MSVFESVRNTVSAETAAIKYAGIKPVRRGTRTWALCPFHSDKNPSMLFNDDSGGFYCFGCGKGGDASSFVSLYYGIPAPDAAKLIAADFGIDLGQERQTEARIKRKRANPQNSGTFTDSIQYCGDALAAAIRFWRHVKDRFSPAMMNGEFTDEFAKACLQLPEMEDLDDRFRYAGPIEQAQIIIEYQKEFKMWHAEFMPGGKAWDWD